jgi:hypothetical protein
MPLGQRANCGSCADDWDMAAAEVCMDPMKSWCHGLPGIVHVKLPEVVDCC